MLICFRPSYYIPHHNFVLGILTATLGLLFTFVAFRAFSNKFCCKTLVWLEMFWEYKGC